MTLGIGKVARLHTATAESQASYMKGVGNTDGWVATAAWTAGLALLVTVLTGGIWTALLLANLASTPAIPWAVAAMTLVLWSVWSYLGGRWRPYRTGEARRRYLRARRVSGLIFTWALSAGALSVVSLAGLWIVMFRLVRMPGNAVTDLSRFPLIMAVGVLAMASLVSSISEEAGFRGYFQVALESHFRGPAAVVIAALLIAPAHGLTQGFLWPTVLFYFLVDAMLGTSASYGLKSQTMIQVSECRADVRALPDLQFFMLEDIVGQVHNHGMKAHLKPALERGQISFRRPDFRCAIPTVELFFKNVSDAIPQILQRLIEAVAFRHQVDRRLLFVDLRLSGGRL